jgi:hypothetical protein
VRQMGGQGRSGGCEERERGARGGVGVTNRSEAKWALGGGSARGALGVRGAEGALRGRCVSDWLVEP